MGLPTVLVVSLGGTITMTAASGGTLVPTLQAEDLVASVPALREVAQLRTHSLSGLPGASLTIAGLLELAALLRRAFADGIDGAVVIQGTDTIEDTAFVLDVLIGQERPVVVTGAMRGPQTPGADGPANLLAAVRVAAHPGVCGAGVLVVMNDEVHAARHVQKSHTALPSAFTSPGSGPIGLVCEGAVQLWMQPRRPRAFLDLTRMRPAHVAQVPLGLGEDGRVLARLLESGYEGAVIEGMGAGHVPQAAVATIARLIEQMPVVLGTRVRGGPVFTGTYGFPGSETDLIARGAIPCGQLTASKSRLLLSLLLGSGLDRAAIRTAFLSPG
jgi:L-asparaginase